MLHSAVHMKSDRNSCVKNEKKRAGREVKKNPDGCPTIHTAVLKVFPKSSNHFLFSNKIIDHHTVMIIHEKVGSFRVINLHMLIDQMNDII